MSVEEPPTALFLDLILCGPQVVTNKESTS